MLLDRVRPVLEHPGPYVTIHVDVSRDSQDAQDQLDARWTTIRHELEDACSDELLEDLERRLRENPHVPGEARRTIVAAGDEVLLDEVQPGHASWPETVDRSDLPDLAGWLRGADAQLPFLLVRADRVGADLAYYRAVAGPASQEQSVDGQDYYITKVPEGDWAQAQYQRGAEEAWKRNAGEVAEAVRSVVRRQRPRVVLVAGDVRAVQELLDQLANLPAPVVKLESGGRAEGTSEEALMAEVQRVLAGFAAHDQEDLMDQLRAAAGRDQGEAARGVPDVLAALAQARVDRLLIDPDDVAGTRVRPADCAGLPLPDGVDGRAEHAADRVLLAAAALSDAEVTVLPAEVSPGGGASALLRWAGP